MPSSFTLRMQFGPHQDVDEIIPELLKLVQIAPIDEVLFFYYGEELNDGHDTIERVKEWIEHSRPYRKALEEAGVTISLNPWHSLLHCDRYRKLKPGQNWQTMVDPNGRAAEAVVCPLDEGWREYYAETLRLYAREGFRVIWVDDDIRLANHTPLEWGGCFCPLHVAEFNRRAGTDATREEIVANCTASGTPHPWREIWLDMWDATQRELIARWREIVEAEGSRLGLMSSSPEAHAAEGRRWEKWWEALAGDKPPIHRPNYWGYSDTLGSALLSSIAALDQNRIVQPDEVENGPEVECFPYGRWNKSFRQIGAQMALGQIMGASDLKISVYDQIGNLPSDEPQRAEFLRGWRPACDWLADEFPMSLQPVGVGIPWSQDMGRQIHTDGSGKWQSLVCPSRGWASWLGSAGHAFSMRPSPVINALGGPVVWSFSDGQLREWLSRAVLIDGVAASILLERGMGELIGVRSGHFITQSNVLYSIENCLDEAFALRVGAQMSVNDKRYADGLFQAELGKGARVVSDLRSPTFEVVGHGLVIFENELGGRVALVPWSANADVQMNPQRAAQLNKVMEYLDPENHHGYVEGGAWLVPQFLADDERWRGVVWNASPDELEEFSIYPPSGLGEPSSVVQVNARGERIEAQVDSNCVMLSRPVQQWEFVVVA